MTCLLDTLEENPSQFKDMAEFARQIRGFVVIIRDSNEKQAKFLSSMLAVGKFSKAMRISTRRIADAIKRCSNALAVAEVWDARFEQLGDRASRITEGFPTS
jgi:hypothetical protein